MNDEIAIQATYQTFKHIQGRKLVQLVFEIPQEEFGKVTDGFPLGCWVGIARLNPPVANGGQEVSREIPKGSDGSPPLQPDAKPRRRFSELPPSQQAAMRCDHPLFQSWLGFFYGEPIDTAERAADYVKLRCQVMSRGDIKPGTEPAREWAKMESDFQEWRLSQQYGENLAR